MSTRCLALLLSCAALACAQDRMNVALTDLQGEGVDASTVRVITDRLRTELFKTGVFTVVERGQMEEILQEQGFQQSGCTSDACVVEVGQILGVKGMLAGSVGKVGTLYTLNVRLIDVGSATITQSVNVDCRCEVEQVLTMSTADIAARLVAAVSGTPLPEDHARARRAVRDAGAQDGRLSRGQKARMWIFGSLCLVSGGAGILVNSFVQDRVDEAEKIAATYEQYVSETGSNDRYEEFRSDYDDRYRSAEDNATTRNVCYGLAGVCTLGFALSIFF